METQSTSSGLSGPKDRPAVLKVALLSFFTRWGPLVILLLLCAVIGLIQPRFLTFSNIINVLHRSATLLIVAMGMTFVILTAGIDLSVGGVMGLAGAVLVGASRLPVVEHFALAAALLLGAAVGCGNAFMVTRFRMAPFVVTLATMAITRSITWVYTGGNPLTGVPSYVAFLGRGHVGPFPPAILLALVLFLILGVLLQKTRFGTYTYGIGANNEAARRFGVDVRRHLLKVYALSGALAAVAGVIISARLNSAYPNTGEDYELMAIAAVIVGGSNLFGGEGRLIGTLFGVLIIEVIRNGLNLIGINVFWHKALLGFIILIAVISRTLASRES